MIKFVFLFCKIIKLINEAIFHMHYFFFSFYRGKGLGKNENGDVNIMKIKKYGEHGVIKKKYIYIYIHIFI